MVKPYLAQARRAERLAPDVVTDGPGLPGTRT